MLKYAQSSDPFGRKMPLLIFDEISETQNNEGEERVSGET